MLQKLSAIFRCCVFCCFAKATSSRRSVKGRRISFVVLHVVVVVVLVVVVVGVVVVVLVVAVVVCT